MTTGNLLEQTVLDLCDDTYYDKLGFKAYEVLGSARSLVSILC